ncbi:hypothetical protein [Rhizobium sp. RU20A]|uniref:hypothetical protein n=1 Tax=Rhizobium sp. RU20A TaxID=1907412 RepID=UPI00122CAED5|nr:hypothetical protein [Rhizobium sp. RU20A]
MTGLAIASTLMVSGGVLPAGAMPSFGGDVLPLPATLLHLVDARPQATNAIVAQIASVTKECRQYDPVYRTDCLAIGLKQIAQRLPSGDYKQARAILSRAASDLSSLVSRNLDSSVEPLKAAPNANPNFKASRSYRAVKKAALAAVTREAQAIIREAVTELLRAYENSDKRHAHYQKIAGAVDGTKVLLRS